MKTFPWRKISEERVGAERAEELRREGLRGFPVLYNLSDRARPEWPRSVPWDFLAPHEAQAQKNHSQTLKRLSERGGLCPREILSVLDGKSWSAYVDMPMADAVAQLEERLQIWLEEP